MHGHDSEYPKFSHPSVPRKLETIHREAGLLIIGIIGNGPLGLEPHRLAHTLVIRVIERKIGSHGKTLEHNVVRSTSSLHPVCLHEGASSAKVRSLSAFMASEQASIPATHRMECSQMLWT